ncbi:LexA family transcriptional regulator [Candidatus Roizmanbacteria bacterium]|nr:LexA family transcriptional regulator [Candidatus Roizmanbacteria bacterium]
MDTTARKNSLKRFFKKHRRLPSYSEMLHLFGLSSKNAVFKIVQRWIAEGFLKKEGRKLAPTSRFFSLPLLGLVKAGFPILSEEDKKYLTLDDYLIEDPVSSFLLTVSGDSLHEIGIFEGDIVVVERRKNALPGDIVLAEIDREWTLKILRRDRLNNRLYLASANSKYPPFYPQTELTIHGIVKAVIRKLRN